MKTTTLEQRKADLEQQLRAIRDSEARISEIQADLLPKGRLKVLKLLNELESIKVPEQYGECLIHLLQGMGDKGVSLTLVRQVLPDSARLNEARTELVQAKKIREVREGQSFRLFAETEEAVPA